MTKLEAEIFIKIKRSKYSSALKGATDGRITIEQAKAAAEVAARYIQKAYIAGTLSERLGPDMEKWMKQLIVGVTPEELEVRLRDYKDRNK